MKAAERRHNLARGASPWFAIGKLGAPEGRHRSGAWVVVLSSGETRVDGSSGPTSVAVCRPFQGWRMVASGSRGLRPWLNYAAAPRLADTFTVATMPT